MQKRGILKAVWPAKFLDINIIQNVWVLMARRVYCSRCIYNKVEDLKAEIKDVWETSSVEYLQNLYRSIPRRLLAVIDTNGGDIKHQTMLYFVL